MPAVRQQINIDTTPKQVWQALTTVEGVCAWWCTAARIDAREGGRMTLTTVGKSGGSSEERGFFHAFRPIRRLEIAWDSNSPAVTKGTRIVFQVAKDGDETRLAVVHSGKELLEDPEEYDRLFLFWRTALLNLRGVFEG